MENQFYTHVLHVTQQAANQQEADERIEKIVEQMVDQEFAVTVGMIEPEILTVKPAGFPSEGEEK